ncbi:cysteine--tRNA ligase [Candidatus Omnitrophota bacterium]
MEIYNTLTRKKEKFTPLKKNAVGMYVCGPTVYDEPHIGHAMSAYIFDVIRRYLVYSGFKVTFVRNVTDVDDKIINKARQEFKGEDLNLAVRKVSEKYLDSYKQCMGRLGILEPDKEPKATLYIDKMKEFIARLIDKGAAYPSLGDVYFDIKKAKHYGKLSNQKLENLESGARIATGEKKKDPLDFALWKKAKPEEPSWDSPWGKGRPGWHIECSAMSSDLLGREFDIHAGGIDLIFPHHENEIAQSEGAGEKFARYWMHNGLLTIKSQKMAKSLGNFITITDFEAKHKDLDLLKLLFVTSHYRNPVDYTEEKIIAMKNAKERILIFLKRTEDALKKYGKPPKAKAEKKYEGTFRAAMDDDFNTPLAISVIFKSVDDGNRILEKETLEKKDAEALQATVLFVAEALDIFGISHELKKVEDKAILEKIRQRNQAREDKDFKKADQIRNELLKEGIVLEDTKEGTVWRKKA